MRSKIHHIEHGANPSPRRDVEDIGVLSYLGKDLKRVGAMSMELHRDARSITLAPQTNDNLISHPEPQGRRCKLEVFKNDAFKLWILS